MTNSVELRREDWKKLQAYHEVLGRFLFDTTDFLDRLRHIGVHSALEKQAMSLFERMEPVAKFFFVEDAPFGIQPLGDA